MNEPVWITVREIASHVIVLLQAYGATVTSGGVAFPPGTTYKADMNRDVTVNTQWYKAQISNGPTIYIKQDKKREEAQIFVTEAVEKEAYVLQAGPACTSDSTLRGTL